jgi:hypothetical protein
MPPLGAYHGCIVSGLIWSHLGMKVKIPLQTKQDTSAQQRQSSPGLTYQRLTSLSTPDTRAGDDTGEPQLKCAHTETPAPEATAPTPFPRLALCPWPVAGDEREAALREMVEACRESNREGHVQIMIVSGHADVQGRAEDAGILARCLPGHT